MIVAILGSVFASFMYYTVQLYRNKVQPKLQASVAAVDMHQILEHESGAIGDANRPKVGIALSGGGIRSARLV